MNVAVKIKTLLQEAELYRSQGLLKESIGKYRAAADILQKVDKIKNRDAYLDGIARKIRAAEKELDAFLNAPITPEMTATVQDLIKEKFSFAKDDESRPLEGAIALAKFGQYSRALAEFRSLLSEESVKVAAAKNIIRCHISRESFDEGIEEFRQWDGESLFSLPQLENLRVFFQGVLDKRGIDKTIELSQSVAEGFNEIESSELGLEIEQSAAGQEEELLDISSIGVLMEDGPQTGERVEFDVSFQSGKEISLLIPSREKAMIEHLRVGTKLNDIEFYSPFAMFQGAGIVTSNTKIATGPKRGDFSLDIKVTST
jgi:tetratricopeptide (TPR) repeat protein